MTTLAIVETIEVDQVVIDENRTIVEVLPNVSIGVQGPQGPQGPAGADGVFTGTYPYYFVSTSQTLSANHGYYIASGAIALVLPSASAMSGKKIDIKNIDRYTIVVSSAESIDGNPSVTLGANDSIGFFSISTGWIIV